MATEVFTKQEISVTAPFSAGYYAHYYDNNIYYITENKYIYKYDIANNIYTLIFSLGSGSYPLGQFGYQNYIYFFSLSSYSSYTSTLYAYRYDILTNTFNSSAISSTTISSYYSSGASYRIYYSGTSFNNKVQFIFDMTAYAIGTGHNLVVAQFDFTTITFTVGNYSYQANNSMPTSNQYNYYCFQNMQTQTTSPSGTTYTNRYGYYSITSGNSRFTVLSGTSPFSLGFRNYMCFERDGYIYILGGADNSHSSGLTTLYKYNINSNTFELVDNNIVPASQYSRILAKASDNVYYLSTPTKMIKYEFIIYDYKYSFYDNSGETVYHEITDNSPTTQLRFNFTQGSNLVGYVLNEVTGTVTGSFNITLPENKTLAGFSLSPNSNVISIPLNTDVTYATFGDTSFYAVYTTYKPPTRTFGINLYQYSAEDNRVDKTSYLTDVATLLGALRTECSIIRPTIDVQFEDNYVPTCNYIYIPIFQRYYFIRNITSVRQKIWRFECEIDVLMTYKTGILGLDAYIARQENDYNDELVDNQLPCEKQSEIMVFDPSDGTDTGTFNNQLEDGAHNFVLTVVGA